MALPLWLVVFMGGRRFQCPGPSPTLGSLGPSHQWRHKSWGPLRGLPCAHGVVDTPHGKVCETGLGKTLVPQPGMTKLLCPLINVEGVDSNMCTLGVDSTTPYETSPIAPHYHPHYQISFIKSQGLNSRFVWLSRVGLADCANTPISQPCRTTFGLPLEATKYSNYSDDHLLYAWC